MSETDPAKTETILDDPAALPAVPVSDEATHPAEYGESYDPATGMAPGPAPLNDEQSSRAFEAELAPIAEHAAEVAEALLPKEYDGIDTRTAEGNYATRSNIERP